jgi:hypothetical protein
MPFSLKPASQEYSPYYAGYVALVPPGDIIATLRDQATATLALLAGLSDHQASHAYAPGKWSVKSVIGHLADAERVFTYRALRFARRDETPLPGYDEKDYAGAAGCDERSLAGLLAEFAAVRQATIALLEGLPADAWSRAGQANGALVTVRALAWIAAGHELHHRRILQERYLTAAS